MREPVDVQERRLPPVLPRQAAVEPGLGPVGPARVGAALRRAARAFRVRVRALRGGRERDGRGYCYGFVEVGRHGSVERWMDGWMSWVPLLREWTEGVGKEISGQ